MFSMQVFKNEQAVSYWFPSASSAQSSPNHAADGSQESKQLVHFVRTQDVEHALARGYSLGLRGLHRYSTRVQQVNDRFTITF